MKEKENLAPQIERLLHELAILGYDRKKVAEAIDYKEKSFAATLSRGGNTKMLNKVAFFKQTIEQRMSNPDFDILKRVERIEAKQEVILTAVCDALAILTHRSSAIIKSEYEKLIDETKK